jgi:hypothetical protein
MLLTRPLALNFGTCQFIIHSHCVVSPLFVEGHDQFGMTGGSQWDSNDVEVVETEFNALCQILLGESKKIKKPLFRQRFKQEH